MRGAGPPCAGITKDAFGNLCEEKDICIVLLKRQKMAAFLKDIRAVFLEYGKDRMTGFMEVPARRSFIRYDPRFNTENMGRICLVRRK